ncbi:Ig domain protein group 1 domain protein [Rouxiella badensis]|uniref:Ig domain protein group 1 domain protein n=1 Tax=Rouxiella badensis TaxID=1646377 RepID=UPI0013EF4472|nr:Ig domain protein group 1 domain protein [Rouxiella badensis]QII37498.1 Ig domain protein group 1 domain protein [Rouxiella badensis]
MSEPLVDASVGTAAQAQPAAVEVQPAAPAASADTNLQSAAPVEASTSALDKAKADFEAFVAFVEHGIEVLGQDAEAELVALKDKYL